MTQADLQQLQHDSFDYFLYEANPDNGLVIDKTASNWPASIAATGLALAAYPIGVERGYMSRAAAGDRTLRTLRFFWESPHGPEPDATGYKGFYYHFLDMQTGRRAWRSELSTVDTAFLLAGALTAGRYFAADTSDEREIRSLADALYRRADWRWAQDGGPTVTHGWKPESGFLGYRWEGYDEALLLYVLGLGSPTHPLPEASYPAGAPRTSGNANTAWNTSKPVTIDGIQREFFDYVGRGVPYGPDDGTIAPWAVAASLPFAPEIVLPTLGYCIHEAHLTASNRYGFKASFNPTYPGRDGDPNGWVSPWHFGINQGPRSS